MKKDHCYRSTRSTVYDAKHLALKLDRPILSSPLIPPVESDRYRMHGYAAYNMAMIAACTLHCWTVYHRGYPRSTRDRILMHGSSFRARGRTVGHAWILRPSGCPSNAHKPRSVARILVVYKADSLRVYLYTIPSIHVPYTYTRTAQRTRRYTEGCTDLRSRQRIVMSS